MVCELEGPTPILYSSKRLVVTDQIVAAKREQGLGNRESAHSAVLEQRKKNECFYNSLTPDP